MGGRMWCRGDSPGARRGHVFPVGQNIALNGYPVEAVRAAAGSTCGTASFTTGRDCVNHLDVHGAAQTTMVTVDSLIGNRTVAGMKVDVEGFEIEVLSGCSQALAERRIKLIQFEWNTASQEAVGSSRRPLADLLAEHGYGLYRPDISGRLMPAAGFDFGMMYLPDLVTLERFGSTYRNCCFHPLISGTQVQEGWCGISEDNVPDVQRRPESEHRRHRVGLRRVDAEREPCPARPRGGVHG